MILLFAFICALLLAIALFSLWRRIKNRPAQFPDTLEVLKQLYPVRLQQLQHQFAQGELSEQQYTEALNELEASIANSLPAETVASSQQSKPVSFYAIAGLFAIIILSSISLYLYFGSPNTIQQPQLTTVGEHSLEQAITRLEERLTNDPGDVRGWHLLARSYGASGDFAAAQRTYERALQVHPKDPNIMLGLAEVIGYRNSTLLGQAAELIDQAMALAPQSRYARQLYGIVQFQQGDAAAAVTTWQTLLAEDSSNSEETALLQQFIQQAGGEINTAAAVADTTAGVTVKVTLANTVQAAPGTAVFIFARAVASPGPPLAVIRLTVADLPTTVTLNDSNAMMPQRVLSAFDQVVIGARVALNNNPVAASGDWQAVSDVINPAEQTVVELQIVDRIP